MKASLASLAAAVAVTLVAGLHGALAANQTAPGGATVASANNPLGRILVDGRGRTLYVFEKDKHGRSSCSGQCAGYWPPVTASSKPRAGAGVRQSLLGTTRRSDGRLQVTYNHRPLYTFVKDTRKGQTSGEGLDFFGAEWYALSPAGSKVAKAGPMTSGNTGDPMRGAYGY